ncbi:MAG: bifunctional glutamine synthetase adenylyltransferase/deadenyltransferase, partial [Pseudomonadota bacterium]|nr:bifunctional glutamine synthetase adenylyltransferase/deadenyltransferase [Pseudomonadota bacterium]
MSQFDAALATLPAELRQEVAVYWQDFTAAAADTDLTPLLAEPFLQQLVRVWACSQFVARACQRNPALLPDLAASGDLAAGYPPEAWAQRLAQRLEENADEAALSAALRRFRLREMVRIAWRDLAGLAGLAETLADLSALADTAIHGALEHLHAGQCRRFGAPRDGQGQAQQLVVLGMGKLGGRELNFSSDIDLIFAYPRQGHTDGPRSLDNDEFFLRLGQKLIKALNAATPEGFVFRVDMRLRPFGDSGPLVMSFAAMEAYYQTQGREWERYAMIKARPVAGDRAAGERLLAGLRPFVYRRYLDYSAFESLRNMKAMIAKEVERKGLRRN